MSRPTGRVHEIEHHSADRATTWPVVAGTQGVVSSGHPLVSMAGMRMLLAGGNAFDAAVAAGFAAAVVEPTASYTLCGEWVAVVHDARGRQLHVLSGQGVAPALATIAFVRGRKLDRIPTGPGADAHLSFTVPGAVGAFLEVLERFGTKTVGEVLAPAVQYAEHGFPMYEHMRRILTISESRSQFDLYPPGGTAVFFPGGRTPEVGEILGPPAWTQGPVLMQALGMLATVDVRALGHNSARYIHVITEALKLAFADRERYYGDSDAAAKAIGELLAPAYLRERAGLIRMDRVAPEAPPPGNLERRGAAAGAVKGPRAG